MVLSHFEILTRLYSMRNTIAKMETDRHPENIIEDVVLTIGNLIEDIEDKPR